MLHFSNTTKQIVTLIILTWWLIELSYLLLLNRRFKKKQGIPFYVIKQAKSHTDSYFKNGDIFSGCSFILNWTLENLQSLFTSETFAEDIIILLPCIFIWRFTFTCAQWINRTAWGMRFSQNNIWFWTQMCSVALKIEIGIGTQQSISLCWLSARKQVERGSFDWDSVVIKSIHVNLTVKCFGDFFILSTLGFAISS